MSEKRIVGIDIGSYAVKVVYLDPKANELMLLGFDREMVALPPKPAAAAPAAAGPADETSPVAPPPVPGTDESFDDAPTGVREAPSDADATHEEPAPEAVEFNLEPGWVSALSRLHERGALSGELQATAVPDGKAVLIDLEVPFDDKAKVYNILPHLMVDRLPLAQSEITWDFQTYPGDGPDGARALVGFARNNDIEQALERLQTAGVDPAQLGIAELQLAAIGSHVVREDGPVAIVDLGHELTRVAVVRGFEPLLGRTIRSGGKHITETIQTRFNGTFEEAETVKHQYSAILDDAPNADMKNLSDAIQEGMRPIVRDLRRTFQGLFAKKRIEIQRVYICGGTSLIKNVEKYLSAELGIPVRRLQAPTGGLADPDPDGSVLGMLAIGAALTQQSEQVRARALNLRKGRFNYRGRSSYLRRQLFFAAAAIAVLLCVLGVSLFTHKMAYEAQRDAMKEALQSQTKALLGAELTTKAEIQKVMDGGDTATNSFVPNMTAFHLLHDVTVNMPQDLTITLDRIEVDTDRNLIQVYGVTTDAQAVDRIVSELEKGIECLKEIKKDKLKVRDDKADFELQISSGCT